MDPVTAAGLIVTILVAIFASITAPLILAQHTQRMHREDREADWARQDELAAKAARTAEETNGKLDVIHVLVNSAMTAAMQSEYDATVAMLAMMREVIGLKRASGQEPTAEALAAVDATQAKVTELAAALEERARAQDRASKKLEAPGG